MDLAREHYIPALRFGWLTARPEGWLASPSELAIPDSRRSGARIVSSLLTHGSELAHCHVFVITLRVKDRTQ